MSAHCTECSRPILARGFCSTHYAAWHRRNYPERHAATSRKYRQANPEKTRAVSRRWRLKNPERVRAYRKKWAAQNEGKLRVRRRTRALKAYGLDEAQYVEMLRSQQNACAICGSDTPTGKHKRFHVDHNHTTGAVRGLLCTRCNTALGLFSENPQTLLKACEYLQK